MTPSIVTPDLLSLVAMVFGALFAGFVAEAAVGVGPTHSIVWMRHRLWPRLRDGETAHAEAVTA